MSRFKLIVISVIPAVANAFVASHALAGNFDCKNLKRWDSSYRYKKGELMWFSEGGNTYTVWRCAKDACSGAEDRPGHGNKAWDMVDNCSARPD
jgi:hypothetical protein